MSSKTAAKLFDLKKDDKFFLDEKLYTIEGFFYKKGRLHCEAKNETGSIAWFTKNHEVTAPCQGCGDTGYLNDEHGSVCGCMK